MGFADRRVPGQRTPHSGPQGLGVWSRRSTCGPPGYSVKLGELRPEFESRLRRLVSHLYKIKSDSLTVTPGLASGGSGPVVTAPHAPGALRLG